MLTFTCPSCGAETPSDAELCPDCGATPTAPARAIPGAQLVTPVGVAIIGLALLVLAVVGIATFTREPATPVTAAPTTTSRATSTTTSTLASGALVPGMKMLTVPVDAPAVVTDPPLGHPSRLFRDGQIVHFTLTGDVCSLSRGRLTIAGTLTNDTPVNQTLSYVVEVEALRPTTGTHIARLQQELPSVGPGETRAWEMEATWPRTVRIRCRVTSLTVIPDGGG